MMVVHVIASAALGGLLYAASVMWAGAPFDLGGVLVVMALAAVIRLILWGIFNV